jgi:preprotein translocase subunit SecA
MVEVFGNEQRIIMINVIMKKIFGTQNERQLKKFQPLVESINAMEPEIIALSDEGIQSRAEDLKRRMRETREKGIDEIKECREQIQSATSSQERNKHKKELKNGINSLTDDYIVEAFALVREAAKRAIGLRPFDVQLLGGMVLHQGQIAEMTTGEGKTLAATLPACLNAFSGVGVHVITVNDYLAKRDSEWMGKVFKFLGLTVGVIQHDMSPDERKMAYACDIVYGTNNEFGFDYLRDNMVIDREELVQGYPHYAIVDEVDSILIDEARTPLIISGPVDVTNEAYNEMRPVVEEVVRQQKRLVKEAIETLKKSLAEQNNDESGETLYLIHKADPKNREFLDIVLKDLKAKDLLDKSQTLLESKTMEKERTDILESLYYVFDEKTRESTFSAKGQALMKDKFGIEFMVEDIESEIAELADEDIPEDEKMAREAELTQAYSAQQRNVEGVKQLLKAFILFEKDVDYVIQENKIVIVDGFTGRMMPGRRFSDGIHEAIEAKERVEVQRESQTLATITLQNYFRMYDKLAGMTGTAKTEETEFENIYLLPVAQIPTNRDLKRENMPDRIYKTEKEKFNAISDDVKSWNEEGQPVLVGTISIEKSERLSRILTKKGIKHNVLNAKYHEREAHIISQAGRYGAVTIATNMAGRGTDILLGGNPEAIAEDRVEAMDINNPSEREMAFNNFFKEAEKETKEGHDEVISAGGLHVVGTERHESRRIDNQLRGRSGRQGDPGSSRFYLSLEDDLMRIFGSDRIKMVMDRLGMEEGEVIENPLVTRAIRTAQQRVESQNFEIRKHLLKYDDIMNRQREVIYRRRRMIIEQEDLKDEFFECLTVGLESLLTDWEIDPDEGKFSKDVMYKYVINIKPGDIERLPAVDILELAREVALKSYSAREKFIGKERARSVERMTMLSVIDANWKEYLRELDELREGISWRAYAQKDPFVEFQHEAFGMFQQLMIKIDEQIAERVMKISAMEEQYKRSVFNPQDEVLEHKAISQLGMSASGQDDVYGGSEQTKDIPQGYKPPMPGRQKVQIKREEPKIGRNDPCTCGSGKKYKKCCGK